MLRDEGLGTIPGTAAEILDDEVRQILSPRKLMTERWVEIVTTAHEVGLRSSSTLMYGHIESPRHIARHLELLREIQKRTGGFTEFVPLGFIHHKTRLYNEQGSRAGATMPEDLRLVAIARLFLRPWIKNVQISWVKMGFKTGQVGADVGRERLRRHADGGVDQQGGRLGARRPRRARDDRAADPRDRPHAVRAHHHLRASRREAARRRRGRSSSRSCRRARGRGAASRFPGY